MTTDNQIHDFIIDEFMSWTHRHEGTLHNLAETACQHFDDYNNNDTIPEATLDTFLA